MSKNNQTKFFKPKAHILKLLGDELIKSPIMAVYELVKNSYDADARKVNVNFHNIKDKKSAFITIEDNGIGLTEDIIENVWLEPGTDHRKPVDSDGKRQIIRSPIFNRVPMGEKGVGRFAVHKLGDKITLITRPSEVVVNDDGTKNKQPLDYEITLTIDWLIFSQSKYLEDIPIEWTVNRDNESFYFKGNTSGTLIQVSKLKETWDRRMARSLKRHTVAMLSPKNNYDTFSIELNFNNHWLHEFPDEKDILNTAPYQFTAILDANYDLSFDYHCSFNLNDDFGARRAKDTQNIKSNIEKQFKELLQKEDDLHKDEIESQLEIIKDNLPFGDILLDIYTYDLDSKTLKNYTHDSKTLKNILKHHAGIKIFKDEIRVLDYGSAGNDWLELDIKRINTKSWMSNNQNIGYIHLDSEKSVCLIEKTSREGFVESSFFKLFELCVVAILNEFRVQRWKDRQKWLEFISPPSKLTEDNFLNDLIDATDLSDDEKKQKLKNEVKSLQQDFQIKHDSLMIPAGVGMTASVALHEIEKLVPRMKETVNENPFDYVRGNNQVDELDGYMGGIVSVLRKGGDKKINLSQVAQNAVNNYEFKLRKRKIEVQYSLDKRIEINCDKRYLTTAIMNLVDNSIYWLDSIYKDNKGIFVRVSAYKGLATFCIVDNGPGFTDEPESLIRPFFSRKNDGIGIGLYLVDTIMMKYGKLEFMTSEDMNDLDIPATYRGAGVRLTFKKN